MKIIIEAAELADQYVVSEKIGKTLGQLPGMGDITKAFSAEPITPEMLAVVAKRLNPEMATISLVDGDLVVWISPAATHEAAWLLVTKCEILVELFFALAPVLRLAKRLFGDLADDIVSFSNKFKKPKNKLLGTQLLVKTGGWEGVPVQWRAMNVIAADGDESVICRSEHDWFFSANKDGDFWYGTSSAGLGSLQEVVEKHPRDWEFGE